MSRKISQPPRGAQPGNEQRVNATRAHFDAQAGGYDAEHKSRPTYAEMQQVLVRAIPQTPESPLSVLELGVGTALLTEKILKRFKSAHLEGLEISGDMLAGAQARLLPFRNRVKLSQMDFAAELPRTEYDVICSSLALHHLPRTDRDLFYRRLSRCLVSGGILVIADRVRPPTESLSERYKAMRYRELLELGWTEDTFAKERAQRQNRGRLVGTDHGPSTVNELLGFLAAAGLVNVDCIWKQGTEAVIYGEKESTQSRISP